jgi:hypothetical protein
MTHVHIIRRLLAGGAISTAMTGVCAAVHLGAAGPPIALPVSPSPAAHAAPASSNDDSERGPGPHTGALFLTSHECLSCHNGLTTASGEDVSIGTAWRASIMANSSRDPYWMAGVRRETLDHPSAAREIEEECSICHMPMSHMTVKAAGGHPAIFEHLQARTPQRREDRLALDGVSCTLCHQIAPDRFGAPESFTGGFLVSAPALTGERRMFGPYTVDRGRATVMRSATGVTPAEAPHVQASELCATCHTLYTKALAPDGSIVGELPEQVPYLEWRHSAFRATRSCQSCHMPEVDTPTPVASVLGQNRPGLSRHTFLGGNFFMLRMLNRFRDALGVEALPQELDAAAHATIAQLQRHTATLSIDHHEMRDGDLVIDVRVTNLTGHKLPTAYPSRRAWLHIVVRDGTHAIVFRSGEVTPAGLIRGNDNDEDGSAFEPHYQEIRREDEVQIYESVMHDASGAVTTGLLRATGYAKDNRLLPAGFDKVTAVPDIAVIGGAREDDDFEAGGDRVRYRIRTAGRVPPFRAEVELRYQPIAFRWAQNLKAYQASEPQRFVTWYEDMAGGSSVVLARVAASAIEDERQPSAFRR